MYKSRKRLKKASTKKYRIARRKMRGGSGHQYLAGAPYNASDNNNSPSGRYNFLNHRVEAYPVPSNSQIIGGSKKRNSSNKYRKIKNTRKSKKNKNHQRGGGISEFATALLPEEIVNIGRSVPAGLNNVYNKFIGASALPSSFVYPTQQPLIPASSNTDRLMTPPDLLKMYNANNNQVSRI